jgi:signal transduction histidine kinase
MMNFAAKSKLEQWIRNSLLSSTMLLNLINDLLDLARMENSQFNLNTTTFNLHDVIKRSIDTLGY